MLINTDKSKVVHFRHGRRKRSEFIFKIGHNELETVSTYKYLGVIFYEKGTFSSNADNLAKAGGRALGAIISKIHKLKEFGIKTYEKLFNACVVPILDYCSSVWGFNDYSSVDAVQNRSIRYFLGVHRFAPKVAINGDIGWLPSKERRHINIVRYWNRLLDMDNSRLCKKVFQWDYRICNNNWSSDVKTIMSSLNLINSFENQRQCDMNSIRTSLYDLQVSEWPRKCADLPKLRTYILFKQSYMTEEYVKINLKRNERSVLAQFRLGILPIRIKTGRFIGERIEDRLCRMCDQNQIENEIHFMFHCSLYNEIRHTVLSCLYEETIISKTDNEKLYVLMNQYPRKTAKYLVTSLERRKRYLYSPNTR